MMRFEYDPHFVEAVTFLASRANPERECRLHERVDPLYRIDDSELRQRAFRTAFGELFQQFGLDKILPALAEAFPLTTSRLPRCVVREAERTRSQSVDLYREKGAAGGVPGERVLIIALCPESLLNQQRLEPWLYRQLQHIEDMLDDSFAYANQLPGESTAEENLHRDRYAVLWDTYIEGRLVRSGFIAEDHQAGLWRAFSKAFAWNGRLPRRETFDRLYNECDFTHAQFVSWASNPSLLLAVEQAEFGNGGEVISGATKEAAILRCGAAPSAGGRLG